MKSVLISIQPKWCELIASGKKTVEVRKTRPKLETPFKCYIYCTKNFYKKGDGYFQGKYCGKVIGEFVCNGFDVFRPTGIGVRFIRLNALHESCLSVKGINDYLKSKNGYGWRISDLVIYDKPKELREFHKVGYAKTKESVSWLTWEEENSWQIKRPFQSWGYVEATEKGGVEE